MSILARYKKNGIMELVKIIEDSPAAKKAQLLQMVRTEDPEFAKLVESKLFDYSNLRALPEGILAEIIATVPAKFIATAIQGETPEFIALCERCIKNFSEYKEQKETLATTPAPATSIESARRKMVAEARKLESSGSIILGTPAPKVGADANPPSSGAATSTAAAAPAGSKESSTNAIPVASSTPGICPSIESFGLTPPPPGLMGERFETYVKNNLGIK